MLCPLNVSNAVTSFSYVHPLIDRTRAVRPSSAIKFRMVDTMSPLLVDRGEEFKPDHYSAVADLGPLLMLVSISPSSDV